jgi:hypothetical protein
MNFTDFATKKQRLTKQKPKADFRLADNDDFYGYSKEEEGDLTLTQLILAVVLGLPVLYAIVWLFLEITPNI